MSAGTPVTSVRIPRRILMQVEEYLEERAALALCSPWTVSDFIVVAMCEKLDKIRRGRKRSKRVLEQTELDDFIAVQLPAVLTEQDLNDYGSVSP